MKLLENATNIYMVGIKGVGMSGLAQILKGLGFEVRGSDTTEKFFTDTILKRAGIRFKEGFSPRNISSKVDLVISSEAYLGQESHCELKEAKNQGLPITSYSEVTACLFNQAGLKVAVAGSHGKSTTAAMIGEVLETSHLDPFCLLGSEVLSWHSNARIPQSISSGSSRQILSKSVFVLEADEYQGAFLKYHPNILVLTNIDYDHPDFFPDEESYTHAFRKLVNNMKAGGSSEVENPILICGRQLKLPSSFQDAIREVEVLEGVSDKKFDLDFPGFHYQFNAQAAYRCAQVLGLKEKKAREAIENFQGTRRRFEVEKMTLGNKQLIFVDDYAHHPAEIRATLEACRIKFPHQNMYAVFQPHTFSRTQALFEEFIEVLRGAPNLILTKTYGSAREEEGEPASRDLYRALREKGKEDVHYIDSIRKTAGFLKKRAGDENVILTLGAGDVWKVREILQGQ